MIQATETNEKRVTMHRLCLACQRPAYWCACAIVLAHPILHPFEGGALDALVTGCMSYIATYRGE